MAVFVDGCLWHGCPLHYVEPTTRREFWTPRINGNMARDVATTQSLTEAGWIVLRFWEHKDPNGVVVAVAKSVNPSDSEMPRPSS